MFLIKYIKCENLFSFEKIEYKFLNNQTSLIYGINNTDFAVSSNGSGKSSLIELISLLITGTTLRDINKDEIIRNECKSGYLEGLLINPLLKKELLIKMYPHTSKTSKVELYINGVIREDLKDLKPKDTYDEIMKIIGISKDDLFNYFIISKEKYESFFLSNDSTKKSVINRFSKANLIDPIDIEIDEDIKKEIAILNNIKVREGVVQFKIDSKEKEINEKINIDYEKEKEQKIQEILTDIENLNISIVNENKTKKENNSLIKKHINNISLLEIKNKSIDLSIKNNEELLQQNLKITNSFKNHIKKEEQSIEVEVSKINKQINTTNKEIDDLKEEQNQLKSLIADIESNIADSIECPKCKHKFVLRDKEFDIKEAITILPEIKKELNDIDKQITKSNNSIIKDKDKIKKIKDDLELSIKKYKDSIKVKEKEEEEIELIIKKIKNEKNKLTDDINKINTNINSLEFKNKAINTNILVLEKNITNLNTQIYIIKNDKSKFDISILQRSLYKLKSLYSVKQLNKTEQQEKVDILNYWKHNFKKFKSYLANNSIAAIEGQSNYFLNKMKTNLSIKVDGFRELSSGKLKEEIEIKICRDGVHDENFSKFSGGEKSKCDLACIFAMQKLINLNTFGGGLNLLVIDEILESNDSTSLEHIVKALSNIDQTILMITHIDPDKSFDCGKIVVEKNKGVSIIKN